MTPQVPAARAQHAGLGRRIGALMIDWLLASLISAGFFDYDPLATLAVFAVMTVLLVGTIGSTIGHRVCGIGVRGFDGGPPGLLRGLVRTLGLCLVIPAAVWGADGRGLHDRWAGTDVVTL